MSFSNVRKMKDVGDYIDEGNGKKRWSGRHEWKWTSFYD
jgi:hypothetical protein